MLTQVSVRLATRVDVADNDRDECDGSTDVLMSLMGVCVCLPVTADVTAACLSVSADVTVACVCL